MRKPALLDYSLSEGVRAFCTTRHGGMSHGVHGELNINRYCGDDEACVRANRQSLCDELGISERCLVVPHQVHGAVVRRISPDFLSYDDARREEYLEGVDAVMTDMPRVCVGVSTADCIPVLLYDAAHKACCAVHAGWRGTVARIAQKAVEAMVDAYGTEPAALRCVIGPGISLARFEVGDEVYEQFEAARFDMKAIARRYAKWHIDLWEANSLTLKAMGVRPENIMVAGVCTYDHVDDFFSARRLGICSGRIYSAVMIFS